MVNVIAGGAGSGKTCEMMKRIKIAADENKDVTAIIPDQFSFEFEKDLYDHMGAELFNRVNTMSFTKLAKEIFIQNGGAKGRYADDIVKNVMMFQTVSDILKNEKFCFYNRQAAQLSFVDSCLDIVKDFTVSGITPGQILSCAERADDSVKDKFTDIALIYAEYTRRLAEKGYKDGESDISEAAEKAVRSGYFKGKTVFVDAFKSFTADEYDMLRAIMNDGELTVCVASEEISGKFDSLFEAVNKTFYRLKNTAESMGVEFTVDMLTEQKRFNAPEIAFFSGNVLRNVNCKYEGECKAISIYNSQDIYGEGDFVCSEIRRLVMEENFKYKDIAVIARQKETYSSVMESGFERYGIPFYTDESFTAAHKSLFIFIKTALKLASSEKSSTEDWLRYMKTGMLGLTDDEISAAEDYCYKWNVDGAMWNENFPEDKVLKVDAEAVRQKVTSPIAELRSACKDADGKTICRAVTDFLDKTEAAEHITEIYNGCNTADSAALTAVRELKQLWDMLCVLLETLNKAMGDVKMSISDFSGLFSSSVERLKLSSPPQTLDCVRFSAAHTARLSNVKAVFLIGVNEGLFPYAAKSSGLLSDKDRLVLEQAGTVISGNSRDMLAEERFTAYTAVSAASDRLYISYSRADVSGNALYPSVIANQAEKFFGKSIVSDFEKRGLLSFCSTPEAAYYQYVQNYRSGDSDSASLLAVLNEIPEYSSRIKYLRDVENSAEHSLSRETSRKLFGQPIYFSASRFEDYKKCPFMYYCKKGLGIYPTRKMDMDSPSRGTAIHYCLCEFLKKNKKSKFISMKRSDIFKEVKANLKTYYQSDAIGGDFGKTRRYKMTFSQLAQTVTDILMHMTEEFRQNEFVPDKFEYTISKNGSETPLKLTTQNGIDVYFEGTVDRIDVFSKNNRKYIRVIDYKSGVKEFKFTDLLYGVNMQMLLYLFALTDNTHKGIYNGNIPAGVLYMPAKDAKSQLDRDSDENDIEKIYSTTYKMNGFVLEEKDVIEAMEKDVGGKFIPVKISKTTGGYSKKMSSLVTDKQMDNLRKYSYKLIKQTAEDILNGKIEASPLMPPDSYLPCDYCDYYSICGKYPPQEVRTYGPDDEKRISEVLEGKGI